MNGILRLLVKNTANFIVAAVTLVFYQPFYDPFGPAQLSVVRIFVPFIVFMAAILSIRLQKNFVIKSYSFVPFFVYCFVCLLSVLSAINKEISLKYSYEMILFACGALIIHSVCGEKGIRKILTLIIIVNFINGIYGVMQHFGLDPFPWNTDFFGRPMGTTGNPDFYAGHLLLGAFISAGRIIYEKKYRMLNAILLLPVILSLIYAKVVGAWIGFIAGAVFLYISHMVIYKEQRKKMAVAAGVILIAAVLASPLVIKKITESKKRSIEHRLIMWKAAFNMFKEKPVLGMGMGMYRLNYPKYQAVLLNESKDKSVDYVVTWMPHQNYLLILSETGILGFAAFCWIIFAFVLGFFSSAKSGKTDVMGMSAAVVSILGASLVNTFYNIPATVLYIFIFMAALSKNISSKSFNANAAKAVAAISFLFLGYSLFHDSRTLLSNVYLKKANKLSEQGIYNKAAEMYERILWMKPVELNPQADVGMYYFAAENYRKAGMAEKAREMYKKDLEINPYCPEVNNMYGAISGQLGDLETAIKHIKIAVYTAPHYEAAYTNLATAYMAKGDVGSAREALQKFVEYNGINERIERLIKATEK